MLQILILLQLLLCFCLLFLIFIKNKLKISQHVLLILCILNFFAFPAFALNPSYCNLIANNNLPSFLGYIYTLVISLLTYYILRFAIQENNTSNTTSARGDIFFVLSLFIWLIVDLLAIYRNTLNIKQCLEIFFIFTIIIGLTEELFFRKIIKIIILDMYKESVICYILISSLLFSFIHIPSVGLDYPKILIKFFLMIIIGFLFTTFYLLSRNIIKTILIHGLYDSTITALNEIDFHLSIYYYVLFIVLYLLIFQISIKKVILTRL